MQEAILCILTTGHHWHPTATCDPWIYTLSLSCLLSLPPVPSCNLISTSNMCCPNLPCKTFHDFWSHLGESSPFSFIVSKSFCDLLMAIYIFPTPNVTASWTQCLLTNSTYKILKVPPNWSDYHALQCLSHFPFLEALSPTHPLRMS